MLFPQLTHDYTQYYTTTHSTPPTTTTTIHTLSPTTIGGTSTKIVRFGIISEHTSNSSPGLCLYRIIKKLFSKNLNNTKNINLNNQITDIKFEFEFVYFDRDSPSTATAEEMRRVASRIVYIDHNDLNVTRHTIAAERIDILLYLALPTEKFTVLLSQARLATLQIQYGNIQIINTVYYSIYMSYIDHLLYVQYCIYITYITSQIKILYI
jgi:hypothetical protein